jgi:hypothetical protein
MGVLPALRAAFVISEASMGQRNFESNTIGVGCEYFSISFLPTNSSRAAQPKQKTLLSLKALGSFFDQMSRRQRTC